MIASDDKNPNFVGAHDPDARLAVRFYTKALPNEFETIKQGRPIFYECDFVAINLPGNQLNNFDGFVNESHKQRFPKQWAYYQNNKTSNDQIIGTPIDQWPLVSKAQAEELRAMKFYTVDSIAAASDAQLQAIGMKAGMQPHAFRDRAQRFLQLANTEATATADAAEKAALKAENDATKQALEELRQQLAAMQDKTKPGRKPKATEGVA